MSTADRLLTPEEARNRLGVLARCHSGPAAIEDARRDLAEANLAKRIREIVDRAPPLTDAQRERLALLLRPGGER